MLFRILYVIFVICQLLWGSYYLGGAITPRQLMVFVMFVACAIEKEIKIDKYWWLYLVFILCFGISSGYTGYSAVFFRQLIGFFFAAFVAYRSTIIMVKKYRSESIIVNTFLIIGLLDAVVTIAQFYNVPVANELVALMHFSGSGEKFIDAQESMDMLYGVAIPGIVGSVINGYLLSFVSVLALYNKNGKLRIHNIVVWIVIMAGSFYVQERSGFFAGLALSVLFMIKTVSSANRKYRVIIIPLLLLMATVGAVYLFDALAASEMRYNMGGEFTDRSEIYAMSWEFFKQHPWGGIFLFIDTIGYPHNLFLNALIYGGWLGGLMIFVIVGMQFVKMLPLVFRPFNGYDDYMKLLFALAYMAFTANSMMHNLSIVTGDATIWILWGGFIALSVREQQETNDSLPTLTS